ncbi:tripartite motif-containing protein 40 isoform X2 [Grammomys surdaster]|uniref:tripartite motif-containing protein 40 isoform X2 n=1 Tax=Grammomys surdaster TaxID=491861 RepID=UPI0010A08CBA|nr:tripartite motif-containing protein 40 isoform X2 [Grammomys surdaster]
MVSLDKDNQDICPICLDPLKEAVSTDCRHLFCRICLTQHMDKASVSGVFNCPVCRKPCSEGVLGDNYICHTHQKRVRRFCETSRHLLCEKCLQSPEHQSHTELSIENAINHYKERLTRRSRKVRKRDLQLLKAREERMLQALQVDWESHMLRTDLQNHDQTKEQLEALHWRWLDQQEDLPEEDASDLLDRSAPQKLEELLSRVSPASSKLS